jgi:hypothetical protein
LDKRLSKTGFAATYSRYTKDMDHYGPFHRKRSPTQSVADDTVQIESGMLWGRVPVGGKCPTAQAYAGPLPPGDHGIEFMTSVKPQQMNLPAKHGVAWYHEDTAHTGLYKRKEDGSEFAVITIVVTKHVP